MTKEEARKDCISRQAVIQIIEKKLNPCTDMFKCLEMSEIKEDVEHLPSVTLHRPKGKWIYNHNIYNWVCSECNNIPRTVGYVGTADFMKEHFKYCNHCGAFMEVEDANL